MHFCMNNKLIPLIAVFIAMVAAAGCMGFPNAGIDPSSALQDISTRTRTVRIQDSICR